MIDAIASGNETLLPSLTLFGFGVTGLAVLSVVGFFQRRK